MRNTLIGITVALLVAPTVVAVEPRVETADYAYIPTYGMTGCSAFAVYEHCFTVRPGETRAKVDLADDAGLRVPFIVLATAPGQGVTPLGPFCGTTGPLPLALPAGTTSARVNFDVQAAVACASVGTTGTITIAFT